MPKFLICSALIYFSAVAWARPVPDDAVKTEKSVEPTVTERREIAKLDDSQKLLIRDCIDESQKMAGLNQGLTVRNCISLIKLLYDSHASIDGDRIRKVCSGFGPPQRRHCEKFAVKNRGRLARPLKNGSPVEFSEMAEGAR